MKPRSKTAELLKVLGQKSVPTTPAKAAPVPVERSDRTHDAPRRASGPRKPKSRSREAATQSIRGRAIQFYLHAPDEKLIREFAVWLAPHRKRINDSLVIKSVLRAAKTGSELLAAYDAAVKVDGRIPKKHRTEPDGSV